MILKPLFIILVLLVFGLAWLFANTIDKRKWVSFLISLILTPFFYFYVLYPILNIFSSFHHEKYFDSEVWKDKPAYRYEMVGNLLQDSLLIKKSKAEITTLLGESEWYGWNAALKTNTKEQWNYNMGLKPGAFNNMQECLEITFKNNSVSNIREYQIEQTFEEEN